MQTLTKSEYAKHRKVSAPMVSKWVKKGMIALTDDGKVHVKKSDAMLDCSVDVSRASSGGSFEKMQSLFEEQPHAQQPAAAPKGTGITPEIMLALRAKNLQAETKLRNIKIEEMNGQLIDVEIVKSSAFEMARMVRDSLLSIPDRLSSKLAFESDPHAINTILMAEIKQSLQELQEQRFGDTVISTR